MKKVITILGLFVVCLFIFQCDSSDPPQDDVKMEKIDDSIPEHYRVLLRPSDQGAPTLGNPLRVDDPNFLFTVEDAPQLETRNTNKPRDKITFASFQVEDEIIPDEQENEDVGWFQWIKNNLIQLSALLVAFLGFIELLVQLTPTEKDNAWFAWLKNLVSFIIPNNRTGGGTHP